MQEERVVLRPDRLPDLDRVQVVLDGLSPDHVLDRRHVELLKVHFVPRDKHEGQLSLRQIHAPIVEIASHLVRLVLIAPATGVDEELRQLLIDLLSLAEVQHLQTRVFRGGVSDAAHADGGVREVALHHDLPIEHGHLVVDDFRPVTHASGYIQREHDGVTVLAHQVLLLRLLGVQRFVHGLVLALEPLLLLLENQLRLLRVGLVLVRLLHIPFVIVAAHFAFLFKREGGFLPVSCNNG